MILPDNPPVNSPESKTPSPFNFEILTNSARASSDGHRYSPDTYEFAFDHIRTCGPSALDFVRTKIPPPSRQRLSRLSPNGFDHEDLTDWTEFGNEFVLEGQVIELPRKKQLRSVFAIDALLVRPEVRISSEKCTRLNLADILLEKDFIRLVVASGPAFREFGAQNWRYVHQVVFVWYLQLCNPEILLPVFYVTRRVNGQANAKDLEIKIAPRKLCAEELWSWEFSQHMVIHNMIRRIMFKNHSMRPSLALLRDTHISKNLHCLRSPSHPQSARYGMTKATAIVIRQFQKNWT
jgi:hypothetical protein